MHKVRRVKDVSLVQTTSEEGKPKDVSRVQEACSCKGAANDNTSRVQNAQGLEANDVASIRNTSWKVPKSVSCIQNA